MDIFSVVNTLSMQSRTIRSGRIRQARCTQPLMISTSVSRLLNSGKLFSSEITKKAWSPYTHFSAPPPFTFDADYGYGWMVGKEFSHAYVGHGGWVSGFVTQFNRYPETSRQQRCRTSRAISRRSCLKRITRCRGSSGSFIRIARLWNVMSGSTRRGRWKLRSGWKMENWFVFGTGQRVPFGMIAYAGILLQRHRFGDAIRAGRERNGHSLHGAFWWERYTDESGFGLIGCAGLPFRSQCENIVGLLSHSYDQ
jgi:hypothetical protein